VDTLMLISTKFRRSLVFYKPARNIVLGRMDPLGHALEFLPQARI